MGSKVVQKGSAEQSHLVEISIISSGVDGNSCLLTRPRLPPSSSDKRPITWGQGKEACRSCSLPYGGRQANERHPVVRRTVQLMPNNIPGGRGCCRHRDVATANLEHFASIILMCGISSRSSTFQLTRRRRVVVVVARRHR